MALLLSVLLPEYGTHAGELENAHLVLRRHLDETRCTNSDNKPEACYQNGAANQSN